MPSKANNDVVMLVKTNPDMSTRSIATIISKRTGKTYEQSRDMVRYLRGAKGDKSRKIASKKYMELRREFVHCIPAPITEAYEPFVLNQTYKRGIMMADLHIPFHCDKAIEAALKYGEKHDIDFIILNGDIIDNYSLSRFEKDPDVTKLRFEVDACRQFLHHLVERFPGVKVVYKEGNHDARWNSYLRSNAAEMAGFEGFRLNHILGIGKDELKNVHWVGGRRPIYAGYLTIFHGDEWSSGITSPVNPARGAFLRTCGITCVAHSHISSEHSKMAIRGKQITCWSLGCMCDLNPYYRRVNDWNHGFAFLEMQDDDNFSLTNLRIHNGKVL